MSDLTAFPVHPVTGLRALGLTKRGPIWPVVGASEDGGADAGGDAGGDAGDTPAPEATGDWWQFSSKEAASEWGNKLVQDRLTRERKNKLAPLEEKNATLEAEIQRLKPFEESAMSDAEKRDAREAQKDQQIAELAAFKESVERERLVNGILAEVGVDPKFAKFISTEGDADTIRANAEELLNVLSEGGSDTGKRTPAPKTPKESTSQGDSGAKRGQSGGGGAGTETPEELVSSILADIRKDRKNGGLSVRH